MKEYTVEISVDGFYTWTGKAEDAEEAEQMALEAAGEADLGELENIDYEVYSVEEN